jgi:hypothetical protein
MKGYSLDRNQGKMCVPEFLEYPSPQCAKAREAAGEAAGYLPPANSSRKWVTCDAAVGELQFGTVSTCPTEVQPAGHARGPAFAPNRPPGDAAADGHGRRRAQICVDEITGLDAASTNPCPASAIYHTYTGYAMGSGHA